MQSWRLSIFLFSYIFPGLDNSCKRSPFQQKHLNLEVFIRKFSNVWISLFDSQILCTEEKDTHFSFGSWAHFFWWYCYNPSRPKNTKSNSGPWYKYWSVKIFEFQLFNKIAYQITSETLQTFIFSSRSNKYEITLSTEWVDISHSVCVGGQSVCSLRCQRFLLYMRVGGQSVCSVLYQRFSLCVRVGGQSVCMFCVVSRRETLRETSTNRYI